MRESPPSNRPAMRSPKSVRPLRLTYGMDILRVDCSQCSMRGLACGDCVMSVFLSGGAGVPALDETEQNALSALSDEGLLPPLRLVHVTASQVKSPRRQAARQTRRGPVDATSTASLFADSEEVV